MQDTDVVCGCINVTVGDIKKAISNGAKTFEDVQKATNVGTGCQECVDDVKKLVSSLL